MRFFLILLICSSPLWADFGKIEYQLSTEPIDIVMPCAPKDKDTLEVCIRSLHDCSKNIRRVIVISKEPMTNLAEWYDEKNYPFSLRDVIVEIFHGDESAADAFIAKPASRATWIFQQFLKLYAPFVIPGVSSNVLIVDADCFFLNPIEFISPEGVPIFNTATEYMEPYFKHAERLLPGLRRVYREYSGICNYMLFQKPILEDLFQLIQEKHGVEAWKALCRCIDHEELDKSCLSEYEIYFNFVLLRTNQCRITPLLWDVSCNWNNHQAYRNAHYVYITCHRWLRDRGW
jgi:Family of unknown function (DUF6492)